MTIFNTTAKLARRALLATALTFVAGGAAMATDGYGDCPLTGEKGSASITPAVPGQFTVIINLPAVGQFNGDTPETIKDGYEFCMAVNIAHRLGLDKVKLVNASFDSIVAGQNRDFDIATTARCDSSSRSSSTSRRARRRSGSGNGWPGV